MNSSLELENVASEHQSEKWSRGMIMKSIHYDWILFGILYYFWDVEIYVQFFIFDFRGYEEFIIMIFCLSADCNSAVHMYGAPTLSHRTLHASYSWNLYFNSDVFESSLHGPKSVILSGIFHETFYLVLEVFRAKYTLSGIRNIRNEYHHCLASAELFGDTLRFWKPKLAPIVAKVEIFGKTRNFSADDTLQYIQTVVYRSRNAKMSNALPTRMGAPSHQLLCDLAASYRTYSGKTLQDCTFWRFRRLWQMKVCLHRLWGCVSTRALRARKVRKPTSVRA